MKSIIFTGVLALVAKVGESAHIRNYQHQALDSLNPLQAIQLQTGDWTAALPDAIRGLTSQTLGGSTSSITSGLLGGDSTQTSSPSTQTLSSGLTMPTNDWFNSNQNLWGHK